MKQSSEKPQTRSTFAFARQWLLASALVLAIVATPATSAAPAVPLPFAIQISGGYANAVAVAGDCASIAAGAKDLTTVDFSVNPPKLTTVSFAGFANDVVMRRNRAFLAAGTAGLQIYDVSDCQSPSPVGSLQMPSSQTDVMAVALAGNLVALADRFSGIWWIDISDPSNPVLKNPGFTAIPGGALGVSLSQNGTFAVVANQAEKLVRTIELPLPWSPVISGQFETGDPRDARIVEGVHPAGPIAVVADYQNSMTFLDLSDLANPVFLYQTSLAVGGQLFDVAISGTCAFGAAKSFGAVPVVGFSPSLSRHPPIDLSVHEGRKHATGVAIAGDVVYITASREPAAKGVFAKTFLYVHSYSTAAC